MFARQMPTVKSEVDFNKVIADTLDLLQSRLKQSNIRLETELNPKIPLLFADPSQITQMITNLTVNALQAMPQGGTIKISTYFDKDNTILIVSDSGIGIEEDQLEKIFLPFYSTKPVGVGTGLGLSVVHGIITSHNGTVKVTSKPGKGSTFVVTLPAKSRNNKGVADE
jgi:signal transduction histidine kinase